MLFGTIKWFNTKKGYGFIDYNGEQVFVHYSSILDGEYKTLIHSDFCLTNILVKDDKVVGFIDLGDSGIGNPWRDYAWCIWSLEYNLKSTNYTPLSLKKLNITFDKEKYKKYINLQIIIKRF